MISDKKKRVTKPRMRTYTTKNHAVWTTRLAHSRSPNIARYLQVKMFQQVTEVRMVLSISETTRIK